MPRRKPSPQMDIEELLGTDENEDEPFKLDDLENEDPINPTTGVAYERPSHGTYAGTQQAIDPDFDQGQITYEGPSPHPEPPRKYPEQVPNSITGEVLAPLPTEVTFESRIRIFEAWQYPGNLGKAPAWIDRNWVAFGDYDVLRDIPPGPALRIPTRIGTTLARIGDYVVQQEVKLTHDEPGIVEIEVWSKDQFQRLFIPVPPRPVPPGPAPVVQPTDGDNPAD